MTSSTPQVQVSLTPASNDNDSTTPNESLTPSISQQQYISSTRASVDSESDYQGSTTNLSSSTPSRPLSRSSSTVSALSTTATKDGVEGKRVHRYHDPLGYTRWLKQTSHSRGNNPGNNNGQLDFADSDSNAPNSISGSSEGNNRSGAQEEEYIYGDNDNDSTGTQTEDYQSLSAGEAGAAPPPNVPSAPPVTLNEKIRLLQTGSVSGATRNSQEYFPQERLQEGVPEGYSDS